MPYEYLEDDVTSDVTFRAWGRDLDELFTAAADATTNLMVASLDSIQPRVTVPVTVSAEVLDLLLMRFLDELVFHTDAAGLILRATAVRVASTDHGHTVHAELKGEPIDPNKHELAADVKAVTLHGLTVERGATDWLAQVTLDV
jgi:SHS2 domain-containing protein